MTQTPLIQLQSVSKRYDSTVAVRDVSLSVSSGELVALLGSSGCGKTSTLRLIAGLERPDSGTITLGGQVVAGPNAWLPAEKRRIGMVFQDYALFPHVNVLDNIAFGLKGSRKDKEHRANTLLELVGLSGYAQRMPHALSGGQQQRVALARALAPEPLVLLLDEPFSNLDASLRLQVRSEVLAILKKSGTTAVFVTHDREEALSIADRVMVMFAGQINQIGTPETLYTQPINKAVAAFVGEANFIPAQAQGRMAQSPLGTHPLLNAAQGDVSLLIRPERLHLIPDERGIAAQVLWREYYGHTQRLGLQLAAGHTLTARVSSQVPYPIGHTVRLQVTGPVWALEA